ncbi:MAG TPA: purine-nucleoside phosphorylase [candidate division Zixibacteria bacterium]|nr:purine-nucleoside phosphorylase [candidate division Zixibacteria bacterium]
MPDNNIRQQVDEAVAFIRNQTDHQPTIGIILGTGLGRLVEGIELAATIPYDQIPHMPVSTVESHHGELLFGALSGKPVVCMRGRFHYYEGYDMKQITFPVRVMKALGMKTMIVSNAAGGLNPVFHEGDIMLIKDHINLFPTNPLIGQNDDTLGPRFPDMYDVYPKELRDLAKKTALELKIPLQEGVYAALTGPCLETGAEYRYLRTIGGDTVGMSTIPEVIVARHQGTRVLAFSIITDMGLPDAMKPCTLEEVIKIAGAAEPKLRDLIAGCVAKL